MPGVEAGVHCPLPPGAGGGLSLASPRAGEAPGGGPGRIQEADSLAPGGGMDPPQPSTSASKIPRLGNLGIRLWVWD